ncbi:MAG TPA: methyltransferase domain-containing protein [Thermoanaerobaculia bacterium]
MNSSLLPSLRCPSCGEGFEVSHAERTDDELRYGLLRCRCNTYPVVAGIPVLAEDQARKARGLIEAGQRQEALLALLYPPVPALAHRWIRMLPDLPGLSWIRRAAHDREWKRLAEAVTSRADRLTAVDLLDLYFHNVRENFIYQSYRYGQPRQLVALSYASLLGGDGDPILDLGCGCGQITFNLTQLAPGRRVIGIDTFFFGLYLAKHWIAPDAEFLCCAADVPLPFPDGYLSAVFCSDSFHYFVDKATAIAELKRLIQEDGLILSTGMHNACVQRELAYGLPLTPDGYAELVSDMQHRVVADTDVLARYFQKQGPPLARSGEKEKLESAPLLSMAASRRPDVFRDHGTFAEWPHARGRLRLNFLYKEESREGGVLRLRRTFPTARSEADQAEIKPYLPEMVEAPVSVLEDLQQGRRTPDVEKLIAQGVVMGMPERYT